MSDFNAKDSAHMARALHLAERGRYTAHPNPMVGCVIVKNGAVVGEGWHQKTGTAHAETNALEAAGENARGATVFVTLEPCAHHGKTPPCADALVQAGVARVVVALGDPHQVVAGRGLEIMRAAGILVQAGLMQSAAAGLNKGFLKRMVDARPFVTLKLAASIDGAIAMASGESQWITGPEAREDVQKLRARSGAVMTGIGTVLADDPSLNVRSSAIDNGGLQPMRVVLDSKLRMPASAAMLALPGSTLVFCSGERESAALQEAGAEVLSVSAVGGALSADEVLAELAARGVNDLLVEAGPRLAGHLLQRGLVDELVIYQAPHIMGSETLRMLSTPGWSALADRKKLQVIDTRKVGDDTRITATFKAE